MCDWIALEPESIVETTLAGVGSNKDYRPIGKPDAGCAVS